MDSLGTTDTPTACLDDSESCFVLEHVYNLPSLLYKWRQVQVQVELGCPRGGGYYQAKFSVENLVNFVRQCYKVDLLNVDTNIEEEQYISLGSIPSTVVIVLAYG